MNTLKRITDFILYFSFCMLAGGGFMLKYSFVKGMGPQTVLGLNKPAWEDVHFAFAIIMIVALCVHLFLNKKFLEAVIFCKKRIALFAVFCLGVFLVLFLSFSPTRKENSSDGNGRQDQNMHTNGR